MGKQADLEKLDRVLKDGEVRLHTIKMNVEVIEREIAKLLDLESNLVDNIECLKLKRIVAIASEFKRAKEDLKKTRARLIELKNDREKCKKQNMEALRMIDMARGQIEKLSGDNNVVRGNFGKKHGTQ